MIKIFKCKRCGREWASQQERPAQCPGCKSAVWDRERLSGERGRPPKERRDAKNK
jgi:predicted Zn-ribbon and HTH transcriptional regulator